MRAAIIALACAATIVTALAAGQAAAQDAPIQSPEITITTNEHHAVKEEVVEYVARLLCRADGCNPDADMRCSSVELGSSVVTCNLIGLPYPEYLAWNKYREPAQALLGCIFGNQKPSCYIEEHK